MTDTVRDKAIAAVVNRFHDFQRPRTSMMVGFSAQERAADYVDAVLAVVRAELLDFADESSAGLGLDPYVVQIANLVAPTPESPADRASRQVAEAQRRQAGLDMDRIAAARRAQEDRP